MNTTEITDPVYMTRNTCKYHLDPNCAARQGAAFFTYSLAEHIARKLVWPATCCKRCASELAEQTKDILK